MTPIQILDINFIFKVHFLSEPLNQLHVSKMHHASSAVKPTQTWVYIHGTVDTLSIFAPPSHAVMDYSAVPFDVVQAKDDE